ncbi:MAG: hypothetical protein KGL39_17265 [Patescibacteria group bacterium]|nr:hypothetical protein [Patescibacteria group bacterium]
MADTYSLGLTGIRADCEQAVATVKVGDSAGAGSQNYVMAQATQLLCKNPDGSQSYYTIDAERSLPGQIVLRAV